MRCLHCGEEVDPADRYCGACGALVLRIGADALEAAGEGQPARAEGAAEDAPPARSPPSNADGEDRQVHRHGPKLMPKDPLEYLTSGALTEEERFERLKANFASGKIDRETYRRLLRRYNHLRPSKRDADRRLIA